MSAAFQSKIKLPAFLGSPAARLLLALWLICAVYLAFHWDGMTLGFVVAKTAFELLLVLVTLQLTHPMPPNPQPAGAVRPGWLRAQLAAVLVFICLTGFATLGPPLPSRLPLWSDMLDWLRAMGEKLFSVDWVGGPGNALANPVQYFVLPFIVLLILRARHSELGLSKGHRSWRVSALWSALPVALWAALLPLGQVEQLFVARRILGNLLQNGFGEEFLFRGALQTRLGKFVSSEWALVLQALLFGLWHLQANLGMNDGNLFQALAACIVTQTMSGLAYGIVFLRTRNLLAPTVAHVMMNGLGQTFG